MAFLEPRGGDVIGSLWWLGRTGLSHYRSKTPIATGSPPLRSTLLVPRGFPVAVAVSHAWDARMQQAGSP